VGRFVLHPGVAREGHALPQPFLQADPLEEISVQKYPSIGRDIAVGKLELDLWVLKFYHRDEGK